ncbi:phage protein [Bordetella petrii]|uniref:phage protein n=1 Tax=Bordetella petrii TaxID=94624 RepID=UPI0038B40A10
MARFNRVYRLLVGKAGQTGVEITQPLRITFEIEKTTSEQPNPHKIRVYNLAATTRRAIEEPDLRCVLYAGYAEEHGPILMAAGAITFAYTAYDGPDVFTELEVRDGYVEIRDTAVSLGYGPGARASVIVREIARQMGLPLILEDDAPDRTWAHGFSFYGPARQALHKVVAGTGLEWSIQNQQLQVIARGGTTRRQAVVLAADSGLLGYPERTREGAREKAKVKDRDTGEIRQIVSAQQQREGWRVSSLLLPSINAGDLVKLESRSVQGFYRADGVRHVGDSAGGDWQTQLDLVDRYAPPKKK